MSKPKVSVIIPVYNMEKYLRQALDSVINQTLKDIEIICVDDCSTDNSLKILEEYASKDERFVILKQEQNQGQGVARNRALDIAKGEYIMFLDPDDWYELNACELCYNQISKNKNDFVIFPHYAYKEDTKEKKILKNRIKPFSSEIDNPNINLHELKNKYLVNCYTVCQIYSKDFLNKNDIRYSKHRICEDAKFFVKVLSEANNISVLQTPLYTYRLCNNSTSSKAELYKELIDTRKEVYEIVKKSTNSEKLMPQYCVYVIRTSLNYFQKFSSINTSIEKDFYNELRVFFKLLNKEQKITKKIFNNKKDYKNFKITCLLNYNFYRIYKFLRNEIWKKEREGYRRTLHILGIKIRYISNNKEKMLTELEKTKEQFEYLKEHSDITKLKPANGDLRELQMKLLDFVKSLTDEFERNNIQYFLTGGNLIGAIRHQGFIPWDDDFDICMMREDYEKLEEYCKKKFIHVDIQNIDITKDFIKTFYNILQNAFEKYTDKIFYIKRHNMFQIFKGFSLDNFVNLDIFSLDYYKDDYNFNEHKKYYKNVKRKCAKLRKLKDITDYLSTEIKENSDIIIKSNTIYYGIDSLLSKIRHSNQFFEADKIFPLKKIKYEDTEFFVPNNPEYYASIEMGDYMNYPNDLGASHHLNLRTVYKKGI